jgi:hypothetical protein
MKGGDNMFKSLFKPNLVVSLYPRGLLKQKEIESIIEALKVAKSKGLIGSLHFEYHKGPSLPFEGGDVLILTPKDESLEVARDRVQEVLGSRYKVGIG